MFRCSLTTIINRMYFHGLLCRLKRLIGTFSLFLLPFFAAAQEWKTIHAADNHGFEPINQFAVNPYTNQLWFARGTAAAVIEPNGEVIKFGEAELGTLFHSSELRFGFTPSNLFFSKRLVGLHLFNNYIQQWIYFDEEIMTLRSDGDTLFMRRSGPKLKYTHNFSVDEFFFPGLDWISKNGYSYINGGQYAYVISNSTLQYLFNDNYYLSFPTNTFQFQNYTDTIYLGFKTGISKAYDGVCFDTITPHNTINMPSGIVMEIEFDKNDDLWVAFGDADDNFFALARLDGNTWVDRYDATNSPIDFSRFHGFEFDTLGNLWVASQSMLHTLLTPNSPGWLSTIENNIATSVSIYPNPATEILYFDFPENHPVNAQIYSANGKLITDEVVVQKNMPLTIGFLSKGVYFIRVDGYHSPIRLVKE